MLDFQREIVMIILASFGRDKPAKSLAFPRYVASNVKFDTENHILWKDTTEYCCCKHCGGRSNIYARSGILPYTLTLLRTIIHETHIVLFRTRNAKNVN